MVESGSVERGYFIIVGSVMGSTVVDCFFMFIFISGTLGFREAIRSLGWWVGFLNFYFLGIRLLGCRCVRERFLENLACIYKLFRIVSWSFF